MSDQLRKYEERYVLTTSVIDANPAFDIVIASRMTTSKASIEDLSPTPVAGSV